jgi:hypothetical protein
MDSMNVRETSLCFVALVLYAQAHKASGGAEHTAQASRYAREARRLANASGFSEEHYELAVRDAAGWLAEFDDDAPGKQGRG